MKQVEEVEMKEKKQQKSKKKKGWDPLSLTVLLIALCVFVFSAYQLAMMMVPYYTGGEEYDEIKNLAIVSDKIGEGVEEAPKFQVDFDKLMQENPDTVAWLRFDQPSIISYPVVKSADNNEYLTKTFSANDNKLGAIFMDMKNKSDFSDMLDCSYFQFHSVHHLWIDYNSLTDVAIRFLYYSLFPFVTPPLEVV